MHQKSLKEIYQRQGDFSKGIIQEKSKYIHPLITQLYSKASKVTQKACHRKYQIWNEAKNKN